LLCRAGRPHARHAVALALALAVDGANRRDACREQLFDRLADLDLVGVGRDQERVHVAVERLVRLLRHDRPDDDVAGVLHSPAPSLGSAALAWTSSPSERRATVASSDALEKTIQSLHNTS